MRDKGRLTAPLFIVNIGEFTAPLCHIMPINNVTINSKNVFVNFCWMFTFALRNHMTERTLRSAELWIGAANSNLSQSNKAFFTTAKLLQHTGNGSRSTARLSQ
jgi:hypothetical protein